MEGTGSQDRAAVSLVSVWVGWEVGGVRAESRMGKVEGVGRGRGGEGLLKLASCRHASGARLRQRLGIQSLGREGRGHASRDDESSKRAGVGT